MPLVNPNIAMSFRPIELQMPNALAQAAQIEQIQAARRQNEVGQMQLEQMRRDEETLKQIQAKAVEHGGPSDLGQIADAYIKSGNPKFVEFGIGLRQKLDERANFERILGGGAPAAPAAPAAAPNAFVRPTAPAIGALGTGTFGMAPEPVNQLAPAAAPAAPVNQLAPDNAAELARLKARRDALLFSSDPRAAAAIRSAEADIARLEKEPTYQNVPGVGLVEPRTGRVVMAAKESTPAEIRAYEYAVSQGFKGTIFDYKREIAAAGRAAGTTVVMPPQEKAEKGERGKLLVKQYEDISNAARLASRTLPALESNLAILDKQDFSTGFGTEAKAAGAKVLGALGVKDAEKFATDAQTFLANATQAVLQRQLEQKGPQTEADAQRITQTGAQLGNTAQANRFMLSVAKAQLQRDIEQRNFYDKWWKDKGTYDGAEDAWLAGAGGKSLFDTPALKAFSSKTATGGAAASSIRSQADAILRGGR